MVRCTFLVVLLAILMRNAHAASFYWANDTAGYWTEDRWLIDNAEPYVRISSYYPFIQNPESRRPRRDPLFRRRASRFVAPVRPTM